MWRLASNPDVGAQAQSLDSQVLDDAKNVTADPLHVATE